MEGRDSRGPNCEEGTCGEYFAMNGYDKGTLPDSGSFATLGIKKSISKINSHGHGTPEIKGEGVVNILFCSSVNSGLASKNIEGDQWNKEVCPDGWKIARDGRKNGKATVHGGSGARNGKGYYIIGFIWDENTQYFGFIKEENLIGKVLSEKLTGNELTVDKLQSNGESLFASTFTGVLDKPIKDVQCLHVDSRGWRTLSSTCTGWDAWKDVITIPMGYIGKDQIGSKTLRDAALVIVPVHQIKVKDGKLRNLSLLFYFNNFPF